MLVTAGRSIGRLSLVIGARIFGAGGLFVRSVSDLSLDSRRITDRLPVPAPLPSPSPREAVAAISPSERARNAESPRHRLGPGQMAHPAPPLPSSCHRSASGD